MPTSHPPARLPCAAAIAIVGQLLFSLSHSAMALDWKQEAMLVGDEVPVPGRNAWSRSDWFGTSLAVDGNTAVIGAPNEGDDDTGAVYVFVRKNGEWIKEARLVGDGGPSFGNAVAIHSDTIVVGQLKYELNQEPGQAYVFLRAGGKWSLQAKLPDDGAGAFAVSVAVHGDTVMVGAYHDDDQGEDAGAVYVFFRAGAEWSRTAKLYASDTRLSHWGEVLALDQDSGAVGSLAEGTAYGAGGTDVLGRRNQGWAHEGNLFPRDGNRNFSSPVAISGDTVLIGTARGYDWWRQVGAAYAFVRDGDSWIQQAKLLASDSDASHLFGSSVAVDGHVALVGATSDDEQGQAAGAAYVFWRVGDRWGEAAKLLPNESKPGRLFGNTVAMSDGIALVSAVGRARGFVYAFSLDPQSVNPDEIKFLSRGAGWGWTAIRIVLALLLIAAIVLTLRRSGKRKGA